MKANIQFGETVPIGDIPLILNVDAGRAWVTLPPDLRPAIESMIATAQGAADHAIGHHLVVEPIAHHISQSIGGMRRLVSRQSKDQRSPTGGNQVSGGFGPQLERQWRVRGIVLVMDFDAQFPGGALRWGACSPQ